jgi:arylsulfatase A-like enzyme
MNDQRPNILLIVTDEQRLSELGAYGSTPCKTPNLDRLAKQSVLYQNAFTSCPLCSPARATVLTGMYPHNHGITCNTTDIGCNVPELVDTPTLLPRLLTANGYSCGFNGKWHLGTSSGNFFGNGQKPALPSDFGFEGLDFPGHGGIGMGYPQYQQYLADNNYTVTVDVKKDMAPLLYGHWPEGEEVGSHHFITDYTISLMDDFRQRGKPFFMHHNFWGPHQPYYVPEKYLRMYDGVEIPPWENFVWEATDPNGSHTLRRLPGKNRTNWKAWENLIKHKYAFMTYIDHQVGRIMDFLEQSGLAENTLVIFTADHGDNLGGHGGLLDKGFVHFDDTHRIPLLLRCPGVIPREDADLYSLLDVYPTVLDAAGIACPEQAQGRSLLASGIPPREYVVTEFHGLNSLTLTMRTIRTKTMKYGWTCCGSDELYDLTDDPHEMRNLIAEEGYRPQLAALKSQLRDWMHEMEDQVLNQYERYI